MRRDCRRRTQERARCRHCSKRAADEIVKMLMLSKEQWLNSSWRDAWRSGAGDESQRSRWTDYTIAAYRGSF